VNEARKRIREINIEQYQEMKTQPHLLVDVREDTEWSVAHAAGAIHLGKGVIERDVEARVPDKSTTLVLYCGGGFRSALAADALRQMGYTNAISLNGGWRAWQNAGLPVEK
jgi:rhodanese-related sulfurtransferase